jgi:hypothetical protein
MNRPGATHHHLSCYDGTTFIGSLSGAGRDWRAFDQRGNALPGTFSSQQAAFAAVNSSCSLSCVADTSARRDNT